MVVKSKIGLDNAALVSLDMNWDLVSAFFQNAHVQGVLEFVLNVIEAMSLMTIFVNLEIV